MDNAEQIVSNFYNTVGWETVDGLSVDAIMFEDLRKHSETYIHKCRERVLRFIPDQWCEYA